MTLLLLLACVPHVQDSDSTKTPDGDDSGPASGAQLAIATTDYQTGALALWDSGTGVLSDSVLLTSSDNAVAAADGKLFVMGRSSENTVRMYGDDLDQPEAEFSTGDATNPQDVALCGDHIVVALYETNYLGLYSLSGQPAGQVDLSAWGDGDGGPEADDLYLSPEGYLYVSLNRLNATYRAEGNGRLLKVDCSSGEVVDDWEVSPNASIYPDARHPGSFLIGGGNYFAEGSAQMELDGWVQSFTTATDTLSEPLLTEEDFGANLGFVSNEDDGSRVVISDNGYQWELSCVAADGTRTPALEGNIYLSSAIFGPDGRLWLAARPGFGEGSSTEGVIAFDPATCHAGEPLVTALPPSSLAWR
ncbi:MAG TPA: hypothetical protein PLA94_08460 [Myxococcota bacterium]|nr:hypothetical protein [Myxococcota bacterium]HND30019.1 hypothetical protein [Myxococcota bacterium]